MDKKSITFIFHQPSLLPVGGFKIVYEYANRLAKDGYEVHLVYAMMLEKIVDYKAHLYAWQGLC